MLKDYKTVDLILYLDRPSQAVCYQPLRKRIALPRTETAEDGFEPSFFRTLYGRSYRWATRQTMNNTVSQPIF